MPRNKRGKAFAGKFWISGDKSWTEVPIDFAILFLTEAQEVSSEYDTGILDYLWDVKERYSVGPHHFCPYSYDPRSANPPDPNEESFNPVFAKEVLDWSYEQRPCSQQNVPLRSAIEVWAKKYAIEEEWILAYAIMTLREWAMYEDQRPKALYWARSEMNHVEKTEVAINIYDDPFVFEAEPFTVTQTLKEYHQKVLEQFKKAFDKHLDDLQHLLEANMVLFEQERHREIFKWLALAYLRGWNANDIHRYLDEQATKDLKEDNGLYSVPSPYKIQKGIELAARLTQLTVVTKKSIA